MFESDMVAPHPRHTVADADEALDIHDPVPPLSELKVLSRVPGILGILDEICGPDHGRGSDA